MRLQLYHREHARRRPVGWQRYERNCKQNKNFDSEKHKNSLENLKEEFELFKTSVKPFLSSNNILEIQEIEFGNEMVMKESENLKLLYIKKKLSNILKEELLSISKNISK